MNKRIVFLRLTNRICLLRITQIRNISSQFYGCLEISVYAAAAAAKSLQSCPTLCDPIDSSPPGSAVPGILHGSL